MYAVIETGGKQYRVEVGTELEVELLDVEPGNTITLDRVLLVADGDEASIGQPLVANAAVSAEVLRQARGDKVIAFKYRPKARRRVKHGHRQELTILRISDITLDGKRAATAATAGDAPSERKRREDAAAEKAAADAALAEQLAARRTAEEAEATPKRGRSKAAAAEASAAAETPAAAEADTAAEADAPAKAEDAPATEDAPAKAETKAKATSTKAKATSTKAKAGETAATEATETKPKRSRAKASGDADADSAGATETKPKRTRTTKKKDE